MSSTLSRRRFLASTAAVSAGFLGLSRLDQAWGASPGNALAEGYGPIVEDPYGLLALPQGFTYDVVSRIGQEMDDGLLFAGQPDGMACFPGQSPDEVILIINHELYPQWHSRGPFGHRNRLYPSVDRAKVYDNGHGRLPALGGTSNVHYNLKTKKVTKRFMSLLGTERNCAGGPTPWGTWITCEETNSRAGAVCEKDHGFNFEVPANATGLVDPLPLTDMGRFTHEACGVDPLTGIVYQTEDRQDGCFYRFIPNVRGELAKGGKLQALVIRDKRSMDTRNWLTGVSQKEATKFGAKIDHATMDPGETTNHVTPLNVPMAVQWIDVENVLSPDDDMRHDMFSQGAARFARGEGMWYGRSSVFFACTTGGRNRKGQIFRYVPSRFEGTPEEARYPGRLELYLEPNNHELCENADNVTVAPWGDLIICEDSKANNDLIGVTPEGKYYRFGRNIFSGSEFAGACFSPDGSTLFVNIQSDGLCLAIKGPWDQRIG